ncbi:MAG: sugar phosphate isomerase/epimerase, partial [Acidobacteria bacterium]|nr:sugar phosphate isomerase/epimerase [Acidobacteriota bacterium]
QVKTEISPGKGPKRPADLERIVKILRDVNYRGYVVLEYEAEDEPRDAVPVHLQRLRTLIA